MVQGESQWTMGPYGAYGSHVKSGRVRCLATGGDKRSALTPELPTIAEAGVTGFRYYGWNGVLAPRATPRHVVDKLNGVMREVLATTESTPFAAMGDDARRIYGVQFHPEVVHTPRGAEMLASFLFGVAGCAPSWTPGSFVDEAVARIREQVGDASAVCGLSGGVDSSVAAMLVSKAIGERLTCIFVDNGVLRKDEAGEVVRMFRDHFHLNLVHVDAAARFTVARLWGVRIAAGVTASFPRSR
jgi:hypothetical protein